MLVDNIRLAFLANGESIHTQKWLTYFVGKGYDVHLITFSAEPIEGVKIHELRYHRKFSYLQRIWKIRKTVKEIDPDILHAHYVSHYGMYGALTGFSPFVVSPWGSDILVDPKRSMLKRHVVRYVLTKADLITVDSESLMKAVINFGALREKIRLIFHGVNLKMFSHRGESKKLKKKLNIPPSSLVVISTRYLEPIYDVETLIKAIPLVLRSNKDVYFIIVGGGSLKGKLEAIAYELGILSNMKFVGEVSQMEVAEFLEVSDIYVSTSLSDTSSVSLLEAMACGLPVVVTKLEGNMEWIKNGVNGFIFPKRNSKELADNIIYLLKNEDFGRKFSIINRKIVEEKGDYKKEMNTMNILYEDLVEVYNV